MPTLLIEDVTYPEGTPARILNAVARQMGAVAVRSETSGTTVYLRGDFGIRSRYYLDPGRVPDVLHTKLPPHVVVAVDGRPGLDCVSAMIPDDDARRAVLDHLSDHGWARLDSGERITVAPPGDF